MYVDVDIFPGSGCIASAHSQRGKGIIRKSLQTKAISHILYIYRNTAQNDEWYLIFIIVHLKNHQKQF